MTDWQREYRNLVSALWRGYQVYSSNGATNAQFERHVWPVIVEAKKKLRESATGTDADKVYGVGFKDDLGAYAMMFGPVSTLEECLGFLPAPDALAGRPCYVIRYDDKPDSWDGFNRIVARWNSHSRAWTKRP